MSHSVDKDNLGGTVNMVVNAGSETAAYKRASFTAGTAMVLDVAIAAAANGEGKFKQLSAPKTSIYQRTGRQHPLKLKVSRAILNDLNAAKEKPTMAFNIRLLGEETRKACRAGLSECVKAGLFIPYDVFGDRSDGARTVRLSCTILLGESSSELLSKYLV